MGKEKIRFCGEIRRIENWVGEKRSRCERKRHVLKKWEIGKLGFAEEIERIENGLNKGGRDDKAQDSEGSEVLFS